MLIGGYVCPWIIRGLGATGAALPLAFPLTPFLAGGGHLFNTPGLHGAAAGYWGY